MAPEREERESPEDPRLSSGVPEASQADELDFIEMTGLTRPMGPQGDDSEHARNEGASHGRVPPRRSRVIEAADARDDARNRRAEEALARALELLTAATRPPPAPGPDVDALVSKLREGIVEELREDIASLRTEPQGSAGMEDDAAGDREPPLSAPPPTVQPSLREAERLVQELQEQPHDFSPEPKPDSPPPANESPFPEGPAWLDDEQAPSRRVYGGSAPAAGGESAAAVDFGAAEHPQPALTGRQRAFRGAVMAVLLLLLALLAGYLGYQYAEAFL